MLSISPLRISKNESEGEISIFTLSADDFSDGFSGKNLLENIDFDDLFVGIDDGDVLPDLELDPEMLAEFSVEGSDLNVSAGIEREEDHRQKEEKSSSQREESEEDNREESVATKNSVSSDGDRDRKPVKTQAKGAQGKRKAKVDWTPELHRRFVQAVEQLGLDKAVPSRILELMGIDCLTRHNIASHLQKYRSHRKHLLAREAEAASWSQRRQMYGGAGGGSKRNVSPWVAPTMGFPPPAAMHPFRPLHVWGHPTVDQSLIHLWPKHLLHSPSPPRPPWAPPAPPPDPYWKSPHQRGSKDGWVPNAMTQGAPCFPRPLTAMGLASTPAPGISRHAMYNADNTVAVPSGHFNSHHLFDFQPSKESIDAAIGDVLAKPLLPLPLGLKPPSLESVLAELKLQGISKIPPSAD